MAILGGAFNFGTSNTKADSRTTGTQQRTPWAPTVSTLHNFIQDVSQIDPNMSADQKAAIAALKSSAAGGNPYAGAIGDAATTMLGAEDRTGMVGDAYKTLQDNIGGYARGDYLDVMSNPALQGMLKVAGDDASDRINQMFSSGGRLFSDTHARNLGRGVTQATAPLMLDQFNQQQAHQLSAAGQLYGAGANTATTQSNLDTARAGMYGAGAQMADAALAAKDYGASRLLDLSSFEAQTPIDRLSSIASILYPAAGLGGTETQVSNTKTNSKTKTTGGSLGVSLI